MSATHLNFFGKSFPMTVLTPVSRWKRLLVNIIMWFFKRATLDDLAALRFIHFARWAIVKREMFAIEPPYDDVEHDYFLFSTNYNGPWDQYIDAFSIVKKVGRGINWLWSTSDGFPRTRPIRAFKRYIRYHELPVDAYYNAYPNATVRDIERALELKELLTSFQSQFRDDQAPAEVYLLNFMNETSHLTGGISESNAPSNITGQPRGLQL